MTDAATPPVQPDATTPHDAPPWEPADPTEVTTSGEGEQAEEGWAAEFDEAPKEDSLLHHPPSTDDGRR